MPKTKLGEKHGKPKYPPVDKALAVLLARKFQMKMDLKTLSEKAGLSYSFVRKMFTESPNEWTQESREKVLSALGLRARLVIEEVEE